MTSFRDHYLSSHIIKSCVFENWLDVYLCKHLEVFQTANFALIVCHSGLEINDSECSFFSTMQSITVLVLVLVWCTQTVHAQQGQ